VETTRSLDLGAIATSVWESLDPHDPLLFTATPAAGDRPETESETDAPTDIDEMAALMWLLKRELDQCRRSQEQLQRELETLEQQLETVPAYLVRLEQRHCEMESRIEQLDEACGISSATVAEPEAIDPWLSVQDIAGQLSLSESTVRRYIREGKLPAARLPGGRGLRLRWPDVQQSMEQIGSGEPDREPDA
jgi:excisionase family DNA binding protein